MKKKISPVIAFIAFIVIFVFAVFLLRIFAGIFVDINSSTFSGFSGLALGLVLMNAITPLALIISIIIMGFMLRKYYSHSFLRFAATGIIGFELAFLLHRFWYSVWPAWVSSLVFLIIALYFCFAAWLMFYVKKRVFIVLVLTIALSTLICNFALDGIVMKEDSDYKHKAISRDYDIFATPNQEIDTEYIIPSEGTISYVTSEIKTPKGAIKIKQARVDENINKLFIPPDKCDYNALDDYIFIWGVFDIKKKTDQATKIPCRVAHVTKNGLQILTPIDSVEDIISDAPYVAIKNNTIFIFKAYNNSSDEFEGTKDEALIYIVKFIEDSRAISNKELGF